MNTFQPMSPSKTLKQLCFENGISSLKLVLTMLVDNTTEEPTTFQIDYHALPALDMVIDEINEAAGAFKQLKELLEKERDTMYDSPPDIRNYGIRVLELSHQAINCLESAGITYVGKLIGLTEKEVRGIPLLKKVILIEIKKALAEKGLKFGTDLGNWQPPKR